MPFAREVAGRGGRRQAGEGGKHVSCLSPCLQVLYRCSEKCGGISPAWKTAWSLALPSAARATGSKAPS